MAAPLSSLFDEADQAAEDAADARADADVTEGRVVSHRAMKTWLASWGKATESPPPDIGD
jgi:predicted transcriptional regulator